MAQMTTSKEISRAVRTTPRQRPRVVILGGGFAGISAAKQLGGQAVDVTLIDRRNHHVFQPLLYQVALAVLSPADIAQPIRGILSHFTNVEVLMDEAIGFDLDRRIVFLGSESQIEYDYLIVATGATHSYFGHDDWAHSAPGLKTLEDATEIRRRILLAYELAERAMLETGVHPELNFVVIGGGPTGVELAGALRDISTLYLRENFRHIDPGKSRVLLIEGGPNILPSYPEDLQKMAVDQLHELGVEILTGHQVTDIQPGYVVVGGKHVDAVVTLWGAGVAPSPLGKLLGVPIDKKGNVLVDQFLNVEGHMNVFVCGDLSHVEQDGKRVPGVAQPAMQMGTHAAKLIRLDLENRPRVPFRYFDKGDMATIGRLAAVADVKWPFKAHWGGVKAWMTWLVVHLWFLVSFRNRLRVMATWAWTYVFYRSGARLITGNQNLPGWGLHSGARPLLAKPPLDYTSPQVGPEASPDEAMDHGAKADNADTPAPQAPLLTPTEAAH
jgi:NADH dehydrogenase